MRILNTIAIIFSLLLGSAFANEVNVYSARHYDSDIQLYQKFTAKTGIKVNVVSGKSGALEKRIIEEDGGTADLYITADAGRLGAFKSKGMLQGGLTSDAIKSAVPKNFRSSHWVGIAKRARIVYYAPERVTGAELTGLTYESLADPKWNGRLVIRKSNNIYNQSLVASLIKNNGKKSTEAWAKGVVSNMARSVASRRKVGDMKHAGSMKEDTPNERIAQLRVRQMAMQDKLRKLDVGDPKDKTPIAITKNDLENIQMKMDQLKALMVQVLL